MIVFIIIIAFKKLLYRVPSQQKLIFLYSFSIFPIIIVNMLKIKVIISRARDEWGLYFSIYERLPLIILQP